jgi:hypothetical protein
MIEPFDARIRVVPLNETGEIADLVPEQFKEPDASKIASITNQVVVNLQNSLNTSSEERIPGKLSLSEIELTFGLDFGVEAGVDVKVPIIGPVASGGIHGGATFEVHIKLSRYNS